jgi:hypothetical protein
MAIFGAQQKGSTVNSFDPDGVAIRQRETQKANRWPREEKLCKLNPKPLA